MGGSLAFEEWAVGSCSYRCTICRKAFLGRARFSSHLDTGHDTNILKYLATHGEAIICRSSVRCGLCGVQVLHDRSPLQDHLGTCHSGFDLFRYYKEYVDKSVVADEILEIDITSDKEDSDSLPQSRVFHKADDIKPLEAAPKSQPTAEHDGDIFVSVGNRTLSEIEHTEPSFPSSSQNNVPLDMEQDHSNSVTVPAEESNQELGQKENGVLSRLCEFACSECPSGSQFKTGSYWKLWRHVASAHKSCKRKRARCTQMATKVILHTCVVCRRHMLQDRRVIVEHVLKFHHLSSKEYVAMALEGKVAWDAGGAPRLSKKKENRNHLETCSSDIDINIPKEGGHDRHQAGTLSYDTDTDMTPRSNDIGADSIPEEVVQNGTLYRARNVDHQLRDTVPEVAYAGKTVESGEIPEELTTESVSNLCVFRCYICQQVQFSWNEMTRHVRSFHQMKTCVFSPRYIQEVRYHRCKLCQCRVVCDVHFLKSHLLSKHNMRLGDYVDNDGGQSRCKFRIRKQNYSLRDSDNSRSSVPQVAFMGVTVAPGRVSNDCVTSSISNLCIFKCNICREVKYSWAALRQHFRDLHSFKKCPFMPKYVVEARYHCCRLCRCCVICDVTFLRSHLTSIHNMSLDDYNNLAENGVDQDFGNADPLAV